MFGLPLRCLSVEAPTKGLLEAIEVSDLLNGVACGSWDDG